MKRQLLVAAVLFFIGISPVFASNETNLSESTDLSSVSFPVVTAGAGSILPDSPFYFVDKLYQKVRLGLVFTAENKAQLHNQIAGERMAELRVMVSRKNLVGIDTSLVELSHEVNAATAYLEDAAAQGKDVKELTYAINNSIRAQREILQNVASQVAGTGFEKRLLATDALLMEAKTNAESVLPQDEKDKEVARGTAEELNTAVLGVSNSTQELEKRLEAYEKMASTAAKKATQNEEVKVQEEKAKQLETLKKALKEAQEAANNYQQLPQ